MTQFKVWCAGSGNIKVAIYDDNAGQPGNLKNQVNTGTHVDSGWNIIPIPSTTLVSGTNYWLALCSDNTVVGSKPGGTRLYKAATYSTFTFPATAGYGFTSDTYYDLSTGWGPLPAPTAPSVTNTGGATAITPTTATLNGNLTSDGGSSTSVTVYWGASDGSTTIGNWANHTDPVTRSAGAFSADITGLTLGTTYYYRCYAVNSIDHAWADSSATFTAAAVPTRLIGAAASDTSSATDSGNYLVMSKFTASSPGNMTQFKVWCAGSGNIKVAIYDDNAGQPGNLENQVNTGTHVDSGWNIIAIPSTVLTSGTNYWLAFCSDNTIVGAKPGGTRYYKPATYSSFTFPSTAGTGFTPDTYYDLSAGWGSVIPPTPPDAPALLAPGTSVTFQWGTSNSASKYQLQVNTAQAFNGTSMYDAETSTNTIQAVTGLTVGTTYYWRARAGNSSGWGNWSPVRSILVTQIP
jgi:hypothetical protein